jgi:outer membrane lipoprotein SlyB
MKKFLAGVLVLFVLAVTVPVVNAQKCYKPRERNYNSYNENYRGNSNRRNNYRGRSFYQKHKDKINIGAGAGAGALAGAVLGGKKGAVIGALLGGGGAAIYTYKIRKNRNR